MNTKAFTLVEVLITSVVLIIITVGISRLFTSQSNSTLRNSRIVKSNALTQEFFNLRKKRFATLTGSPTFNDPVDNTGQLFSGLTLAFSTSGGPKTETFNTQCVALPTNVPRLETSDLNEINNCLKTDLKCTTNQIPVLMGGGNKLFPQGFGNGTDGQPIGASLCLQLDGPVSSYKQLRMRLTALVLAPENRGILIQKLEAILPGPKVIQNDSIRIKAIVPNGR